MSISEVTTEETAKIAGVLEGKWIEMAADNTRLKAENKALNHSLEIMTQDRNYWRERGEAAERDRDEARDHSEFMIRQWQGVRAIAVETLGREKSSRAIPVIDEQTKLLGTKFGADSRPQ